MRHTTPFPVLLLAWPLALVAQQETASAPAALDVYLDCNAPFCDFDHFRREIGFVNWVRDRQDADVHLLITAQRTGGGGWNFALLYIGRRAFATMQDTLQFVSTNTDTGAEVRDGLTNAMEAGLVRYAARTPIRDGLEITYRRPEGGQPSTTAANDPWKFWVFTTGFNGSVGGESRESGYSVRGSFSANRVSEGFKLEIGISGSYRYNRFELDDTTTFIDTREGFDVEILAAHSVGPHWSVGVLSEADRSTRTNQQFGFEGGPAIEFSLFPYDESTRKQVTVLYAVGVAAFDFEEETTLGKTQQTLGQQVLEISVRVQQPWGSIFAGVGGRQFLHDLATHRLDTRGGISLRVLRGLRFNVGGSFSRIKDQIFLPAAGLTDEEILVRRRQRETDFQFGLSSGFSIRWGSKFANVVNPRLEF